MLWSQFVGDFCQFSAKILVFKKTNVMMQILQKWAIFFKTTTSVPGTRRGFSDQPPPEDEEEQAPGPAGAADAAPLAEAVPPERQPDDRQQRLEGRIGRRRHQSEEREGPQQEEQAYSGAHHGE
jgi:hypothetical protein